MLLILKVVLQVLTVTSAALTSTPRLQVARQAHHKIQKESKPSISCDGSFTAFKYWSDDF